MQKIPVAEILISIKIIIALLFIFFRSLYGSLVQKIKPAMRNGKYIFIYFK